MHAEQGRTVEIYEADAITREEWLQLRLNHITSTDAAPLLGDKEVYPYDRSPFTIYREKTGLAEPEDISRKPAVEWGLRLEEAVAEKFADLHPEYEVTKGAAFYSRLDLGYPAGTSIDYLLRDKITGAKGLLEIKTAASANHDKPNPCLWWGERGVPGAAGVPQMYQIQVHHQALCLDEEPAFAFVAVLIGGSDYRDYPLQIEPVITQALTTIERKFYREHIAPGICPAPQGYDEVVASVLPIKKGTTIAAGPEEVALIRRLASVRATLSKAEAEEKELKADALRFANGAAVIVDVAGNTLASISESSRTTLDAAKVRERLGADAALLEKVTTFPVVRLGKGVTA